MVVEGRQGQSVGFARARGGLGTGDRRGSSVVVVRRRGSVVGEVGEGRERATMSRVVRRVAAWGSDDVARRGNVASGIVADVVRSAGIVLLRSGEILRSIRESVAPRGVASIDPPDSLRRSR